jgi:hypothetical protein
MAFVSRHRRRTGISSDVRGSEQGVVSVPDCCSVWEEQRRATDIN